MGSTKATARQAGVVYLLFAIVAVIGEFLLPGFVVPGDATATANNITAAELTYRLSILVGLVTHILFILLVVILYKLFENVDKKQAMIMVLLVVVGVAVALANLLNKGAPLVLLSGADYLSVFTKPQLDGLTLGFLRFHGFGSTVVTAFWGLWLFPFGILVIKSGFIPRILGLLLFVAGVGYVLTCIASIALPDYRRIVSQIMTPLYFGELPIIFWLVIKGATVPQPHAQSFASRE